MTRRTVGGWWRAAGGVKRLETLFWLALAAFVGYRIWPQVGAAFGVGADSVIVPEYQVTTLDGQSLTNRDLLGNVVLVNFWATWCPPCRVEMPGFQSVYERHKSRGFVILGISTDVTGESVQRFLDERGITYPVAMAAGDVVQRFGSPRALPTSFLIGRDGRIRHEVRGVFASIALDQAVERLLAEEMP